MRRLTATTCLTPAVLGFLAYPASAVVVTIGTAQTISVATATANSGSAADVSVSSSGSIKPATGFAITVSSNNNVTNAGTLQITDANGSAGIVADADVNGTITNSGTITINETYTRTDTNGDGVLDGAFAQGADRFGIHTLGTLAGNIVNSGTITVAGNNSAGIALDGALTGSLQQSGTIAVLGNNSVGLRAAAVSGDVAIGGTIGATGQNSSGVLLDGAIGGSLVVQAAVTTTGYSSATPPSDTSKLTADNLLQGGPAMQIAGDIAGGALFTAATSTTDSAGNTVSTTAAALTSYGSAPALLIGASDHSVTLGPVSSDSAKHGLVINGSITGNGVYDGFAANGLMIGGLGGAVAITNGMTVGGYISAAANDADATALHIGYGADVPTISNGGTISASGASKAGDVSTAIEIDAGSKVSSITNSGTVSAKASGTAAGAAAIIDKSGTLTSITNSGSISAQGSSTSNVAIDVSSTSADTTVSQTAPATGAPAPSIIGDVRFGSGNDKFLVASGSVSGNVSFGSGDDALALSGGATYSGTVTFGAGRNSLSLSDTASFSGNIVGGGNTAVTLSGGTLALAGTGTTALGSLQVTGGGTLGININGTTGAATLYQVAGTASFDAGSKLALHFSDLNYTIGTYTVVTAGSLSGVGNIAANGVALPYMFKTAVATNAADNAVTVTVSRKSTVELGLNRSEASAYNAIYTAIAADKPIGDSFLAITDQASFTHSIREMLPDHAGGTFDAASSGSRATARFLADPDAPIVDEGNWGFWLQQVGWGRTKAIDDTAGYRITGWGASGGAEIQAGKMGRFGLSAAYLSGTNDDADTQNDVTSNHYELAAYWRGDWSGLHAFGRASAATIDFVSHRRFDGEETDRTAVGHWNGKLYSAAAGVSYRTTLGRFSLRPQASIDYYRLQEDHYAEKGGGAGMDLFVDARTSDETAANGALAVGYDFLDQDQEDDGFLRAEIEGGRRQLVSGKLGDTTAHFAGGQDFTLTPDDRTSGWTGAVRVKGGTSTFVLSGEFDAERQQDHVALGLRAGLQVGF